MSKTLSLEDIKDLNPTFYLEGNPFHMVEWFTVTEGRGHCCIISGLKHADGVTKSPFQYECCRGGENATEEVLEYFNNWWSKIDKSD